MAPPSQQASYKRQLGASGGGSSINEYGVCRWVWWLQIRHTPIFTLQRCSLWSLVRNWLGISLVPSGDFRSHFIQFTKMVGMPRASHLYFKIIWFATIWVIWKERNNRIFQNTVTVPLVLIDKIKLHSFLWLKSKQVDFVYSYLDWWKKPVVMHGCY